MGDVESAPSFAGAKKKAERLDLSPDDFSLLLGISRHPGAFRPELEEGYTGRLDKIPMAGASGLLPLVHGEPLGESDVERFVNGEEAIMADSTNVYSLFYRPDYQSLQIEFLNNSIYLYSNVTEAEAEDVALAMSKGMWIWDELRIRGTKYGHRKSYMRIA